MASHRGLYCGRERDSEARRAWRHNREAQVELKGCITAVLEQIYGKHNEVRGWVGVCLCVIGAVGGPSVS